MKMEPIYTTTFFVSEDDYVNYSLHATKGLFRRIKLYLSILIVAGLLTLGVIYSHSGELSILTIIVIIVSLFFLLSAIKGPEAKARSDYHTNKSFQDPMTYNFFDDYFTGESVNGVMKMPYNKLYKIEILPEYIFFWNDKNSAFILRDDNPEFREFISDVKSKYTL